MKIMVTGAAGFVGNHLSRELQQNGHEVIAAINTHETNPEGTVAMLANLAVAEEVKAGIDFRGIDAVIHLAGLAAVGPSFDDPAKYINVNSGIEINLFETCLAQDVRPRFVVVSSGSLYDPSAPMPINEESPVLSNSPYSVSKITQEELAKYYGQRGFEFIIARPFNHIGPGQRPGFIVPDFAQQIVAGEKGEQTEMKVGNLEAKRDYTDVRDIARAYRLLVEQGVSGEVYNICSGNSVSGQEILDRLLARSVAKLAIKQDPDRMRPSDIAEIVGDHSKITKDTGWQPEISLDQTLEDALEDWRK